jgi:hypothetical protein
MWFLDGPEHFSPPGQPPRYLTYQNDVRQYVEKVAQELHGGAMPVLYKQIVALSYQLAQFRCVQLAAGSWQLEASRRGRLEEARQDMAWSMHCLQRAAASPDLPADSVAFDTFPLLPCRDALAASAMLNRTLVLPTSWCYCDYDWTPHVLEKCKIRCGLGPVVDTLAHCGSIADAHTILGHLMQHVHHWHYHSMIPLSTTAAAPPACCTLQGQRPAPSL